MDAIDPATAGLRLRRRVPADGPLPDYSAAARAAVFLDFENLVLGAGAGLPGQSDPVPTEALKLLCHGFYGNASIRRAYADWAHTRFGRYQAALADNGVDLVQITHPHAAGKNGADIRMTVDAMEILFNHPDINVFILVTGDSDYSALVHRLREYGKHVVGVGTRANASQRLVSVCSEYKYWGTIAAAVEPTAQPAATAAFNIADAQTLLLRAMQQLPTDTPTASAVKNKMLTLDPAFDEANYGCRSFRDFLNKMTHRVRPVGHSGADITISLQPAATRPTTPTPVNGHDNEPADRQP